MNILLSIDPASRERFPEAKMPTGEKSCLMAYYVIDGVGNALKCDAHCTDYTVRNAKQ